jgi:hypothetical protein
MQLFRLPQIKNGYDVKWQGGEIRRVARKEFSDAYPGFSLATVSRENFEEFPT